MEYKVVLSDRAFNVKKEFQNEIGNLQWQYNRIGGCGAFSFDIPERFCRERFLGGAFNVKIYRKNISNHTYDLWYQGRIEDKVSNIRGNQEVISVRGFGYQSELKNIYVNKTYTSQAIEDVVDDIMDTFVTPNTNITKGTISATGFTADSLEFNTDALTAIQTCADLVGTREWGVDSARAFTFKARSSSVGFRFPIGSKKITNWSTDSSSKDIINRVIVTGGDVAGTVFTRIVDQAKSQTKWGRRDKTIKNSAIVTNAVADQFADAIFAEFKDVVRRARLEIVDIQQIESTIPLGLVQVIGKADTYGTVKYGEILYQGIPKYEINNVQYRINNDSSLRISLGLGKPRPDISESIGQLEYKIDQLVATGV